MSYFHFHSVFQCQYNVSIWFNCTIPSWSKTFWTKSYYGFVFNFSAFNPLGLYIEGYKNDNKRVLTPRRQNVRLCHLSMTFDLWSWNPFQQWPLTLQEEISCRAEQVLTEECTYNTRTDRRHENISLSHILLALDATNSNNYSVHFPLHDCMTS